MDLGDRRIGLAVGDDSNSLVFPAGYIARSTLKQDVVRVLDIARERDIQALVVGVPYTMSGKVGPQASRAQGFIRGLRRATDLPVHGVDERFTSIEAEGLLREAGRQPSREKATVDETAAALILQRFLDSTPPSAETESPSEPGTEHQSG